MIIKLFREINKLHRFMCGEGVGGCRDYLHIFLG